MNRRAAGALIAALSTGKVLLCLRSEFVASPGFWSIPGGSVDQGEKPMDAAVREAHEEVGFDGRMMVKGPIYVHRSAGLEFHTFLGFVPTQFAPSINWESVSCGWFAMNRLPHPLHPGLEDMMLKHGRKISEEIARARSVV